MLVDAKMKKLEKYNTRLEKRDERAIISKYSISNEDLDAIKRLQLRIRSWTVKRKFFAGLLAERRMQHKKNFLALKRSLDKFEREHKNSASARNYRTMVNLNMY